MIIRTVICRFANICYTDCIAAGTNRILILMLIPFCSEIWTLLCFHFLFHFLFFPKMYSILYCTCIVLDFMEMSTFRSAFLGRKVAAVIGSKITHSHIHCTATHYHICTAPSQSGYLILLYCRTVHCHTEASGNLDGASAARTEQNRLQTRLLYCRIGASGNLY